MVWFALIIVLLLLAFWAWMFRQMTRNPYLPRCFISITRNPDPRYDWAITFVFLNIVAAGYYYFTEYRNR